jgi:hypothetical protein
MLVAWLVFAFLVNVHADFKGRQARNPSDFDGFLVTLVAAVCIAGLLWGAGAFDALMWW